MAKRMATFAAGCFWGVEASFRKLAGIETAVSGYTGGRTENPEYRLVCAGNTGHAEAVQVTYDDEKVTYSDLVEAFWAMHDPTQRNRQGADVGSQYRSAIFTHDETQRALAGASRRALEASGRLGGRVMTEITPVSAFWKAEDYHQRYFEKNQRRFGGQSG